MTERLDPYRVQLPAEGNRKVPALVYLPSSLEVEGAALQQLSDVASIDPDSVVVATPDIHTGFGVPIGSVFGSPHYISPSAVGYDINCGMRLLTTPLEASPERVRPLADAIRRLVPLGEGKANLRVSSDSMQRLLQGGLEALPKVAQEERALQNGWVQDDFLSDLERVEDRGSMPGEPSHVPERATRRGQDQLATLGGGNHFIELQRIESIEAPALAAQWGLTEGQLVVMIHSGSRGLGHEIGGHFMKLAAQICKKQKLPMPNSELAYMPADSIEARQYLGAMNAAANFAFANRQLMAQLVRRALRQQCGAGLSVRTVYDVTHNMTKLEKHQGKALWVHRKGATRAFPPSRMRQTPFESTGQPVLIPGSMGTASYVLVGLETASESLYSVNHGAGRRLSRTAARGTKRGGQRLSGPALISDDSFAQAMQGIYLLCEDPRSIKEEAPQAYKDIDVVIDTVVGAGLAKVVAKMRPLAVLKG